MAILGPSRQKILGESVIERLLGDDTEREEKRTYHMEAVALEREEIER